MAYVVVAMLIAPRKWSPRDVIIIAATAFCLTVVYFLPCRHYEDDNRIGLAIFGPAASTDNGYENSLMRWLLYLNPAARFGEFLAGLAAAHLYLVQHPRLSAPRASTVTLIAILAVVTIHLWLYGVVAYRSSFIGRTASPLYGPLVAMTIYLVARYDTPWSRLFSQAIPVRLGEVSYSIYLLHEIIPSAFKRLGLMTTDIAVAWVTWVGSLLLLALISQVSYAVIERQRARGFVPYWRRCSRRRAVEQRRSAARFRCQIELMNILIAAAAPIGGKVLGAAVGRIADLRRVDGEHAGRLGIIASAYQQGRGITDLHQIGLAGRRHEIAAGQAVGRVHDMDHVGVRIWRCQPIIHKLHSSEKRYRHHGKSSSNHEYYPTGGRSHGGTFLVARGDQLRAKAAISRRGVYPEAAALTTYRPKSRPAL